MKQSLLLLLVLLTCNSVLLPAQDTIFIKAVDSINVKLGKWAEGRASVYITAKPNGDISIINQTKQSLSFNLFDLVINDDNNINSKSGMQLVPCDKKAHAPLTWINFYTPERKAAFIRLDCNTPVSELELIRNAFLYLKSLCNKNGN